MKITKTQLRRIIKEAQWGNFTGGAAPLDMPMRDSGPVPKDQLRKMADIFMNDMGMSPEEVLEKPEFAEQGITDLKQLEENKMKVTKRHLQQIIKEEKAKILEEQMGGDVVEIPLVLFNELTEYLEDMSGLTMKGGGFVKSRARELMLQIERQVGTT